MFSAKLPARVFALLLYFPVMVMAGVPEVSIGRFDTDLPALPPPWQVIQLEKNVSPTQYRTLYWDGVHAIESQANRSMALLGRKVDVDLTATPVLCWRWRRA